MSTAAALMLVRDEADIIGYAIDHLLEQVDHIYVLDNRSTDGTTEILAGYGAQVTVDPDPEIGYWQQRKMTRMARRAYEHGFDWVLPVDADELWRAPAGKTLTEFLAGVGLDVQVVRASIVNHVPTDEDPAEEPNPYARIGWRQPQPQSLGKVAARSHPALTIHAGNHSASYGRLPYLAVDGLTIRHYPWRGEQRYLVKIRNGEEAYAATNLPSSTGAHWRMWEDHTDETIIAHYLEWFHEQEPPGRHDLVLDPAVGRTAVNVP